MAPHNTNPEQIDIALSLLDGDAMDSFVKAVTESNKRLGEAMKMASGMGFQQGEPSVSEMPSRPPDGGAVITAGGGTSTSATPGEVRQVHPMNISGGFDTASVYSAAAAPLTGTPNVAPGAPAGPPKQPGRIEQGLSSFASRASQMPGLRWVTNNMLDEEGAFNKHTMAQAGMYTVANAVAQPLGQAFSTGTALANPFNMQQAGMASGLSGGPIVGPIQLPTGEATREMLQATGQAIPSLWKGGIGFGESMEMQAALQQQGYQQGSHAFDILEDVDSELLQEHGGLRAMTEGTRATFYDQFVRYGSGSQEDITDFMGGLEEAAQGAKMSLEEFGAGLLETSETLQGMGEDRLGSLWAARNFSTTTNLAPQVLGQMMQNPIVQGQLVGQTGISPELSGMIPGESIGAFNEISWDAAKMLEQSFRGVPGGHELPGVKGFSSTLSGKEQAEALTAQRMDMGIDEYRQFKKYHKTSTTQGYITDMAKTYDQDREWIVQNSYENTAKRDRLNQALVEGTGRFAGDEHASWEELAGQIAKKDSGFADQLDEIEALDPLDRRKKLKELIEEHEPRRLSDDPEKRMIGFTGYAEKILKEVMPGAGAGKIKEARKAANQGKEALTNVYTESGDADISKMLEMSGAPQSQIDMAEDIEYQYGDKAGATMGPAGVQSAAIAAQQEAAD